jgi:tRNA pseudouridine55 synthase
VSERRAGEVDGLVVVDKPAGMTSHDVVARCRKVFGQRSVGHAGTLDPDATGVLLVGLGRATRLLRFLQDDDKAYTATVVFGVATTTLDAAGEIVAEHPMPELTRDEVEHAAAGFVGEIDQVPPMVSAIKIGGRRLHELARAGVDDVPRAPRRVRIDRIDVQSFAGGRDHPEAVMRVECGSGTYIRSLAADLGEALGGVAHVALLRRTRSGPFDEQSAHSLADVEAKGRELVLPPAAIVRDLPTIVVDETRARAVGHGATFAARDLLGDEHGDAPGPFAVVDAAGELLAVYERRAAPADRGVKPAVVLAPRDMV